MVMYTVLQTQEALWPDNEFYCRLSKG